MGIDMIIIVIALLLIFLFGTFCYWVSQILKSIDEKLGNIESLLEKQSFKAYNDKNEKQKE